MYGLALDGLLLYGRRFIRILSITSFLIFISSLIFGLVILILSFLGFDFGSKGWTSIIFEYFYFGFNIRDVGWGNFRAFN